MALQVKICGVTSYQLDNSEYKETSSDVELDTNTGTKDLILSDIGGNKKTYTLSIDSIKFRKKMYQPTAVEVDVLFQIAQNKSSQVSTESTPKWSDIKQTDVVSMFEKKKVELSSVKNTSDVGSGYYVQAVNPTYFTDQMVVKLKIYSPDKLLTDERNCQSFVAKKLGEDILKSECTKYNLPYSSSTTVSYNYDNMRVLGHTETENNSTKHYDDHIFPYLVQYNESIYDMLARTANRWGEFLYYEGGSLNIGYPTSSAKAVGTYASLNFINLDEGRNTQDYGLKTDYDDKIVNNPLTKSPNALSDKYKDGITFMRIVASYLANDKSLPTFMSNLICDELYALIKNGVEIVCANSDFNNKYFSNIEANGVTKPNYDKDKNYYNPFSEYNSKYTTKKYKEILDYETKAGKDAVCIDYSTTYPSLNLGDTIKVFNKEYLVVQVDCVTKEYKEVVKKQGQPDQVIITFAPAYQVIAIASQVITIDNKKKSVFIPTVLPTGHFKSASPQLAKVADADDPLKQGRVRVLFSWQETSGEPSPWLVYSANAGGKKNIASKHYEGDEVFVGFIDGNVESPYVLGAKSSEAAGNPFLMTPDVSIISPGGHKLLLGDNSGGIGDFFFNAFSPLTSTLFGLIPPLQDALDNKNDKLYALSGGFALTDKYGIYKISGSTEERVVNISSPWGDVNINAFTGITITAPNGDVKIKGKNVSIEAGNNLSLASGMNIKDRLVRHYGRPGRSVGWFFADMAAAATTKFAKSVLQVIDLSLVRSAVEVVMRPVEGTLTLKSHRYLRLEAGENQCEYHQTTSYKKDKKSLDDTLVNMFECMKTACDTLLSEYYNLLDAYIQAKTTFNTAIADLKTTAEDYVNNAGQIIVCKTYDDLKDTFWAKPNPNNGVLTVADLDFKDDQVKIVDAADLDDTDKLNSAVKRGGHALNSKFASAAPSNPSAAGSGGNASPAPNEADIKRAQKEIIAERRNKRDAVLNAANALRTAIVALYAKLDITPNNIATYFTFNNLVPEDLKQSLFNAFNKDNRTNAYLFEHFDPGNGFSDIIKGLADTPDAGEQANEKKYFRRLMSYNLLIELGFVAATRKEIPVQQGQPQPTRAVDEPAPAQKDVNDAKGLLNDNFWGDYVSSLNGLPEIHKTENPAETIFGPLLDSIIDNARTFKKFNDSRKEKFSWGEGKEGRILFATDGNTYEMENNTLKPVTGVMVKEKELAQSIAGMGNYQDAKVEALVEAIRRAINTN